MIILLFVNIWFFWISSNNLIILGSLSTSCHIFSMSKRVSRSLTRLFLNSSLKLLLEYFSTLPSLIRFSKASSLSLSSNSNTLLEYFLLIYTLPSSYSLMNISYDLINLSIDFLKAKKLLSNLFTSNIFINLPIFLWDSFTSGVITPL